MLYNYSVSHSLAVRDRTHALFSELYYGLCVTSVFTLVSCLICLRVQASLYTRLVLGMVVWFVLERQVVLVAMHVFVAKHNKHLLTPSRKYTLRSFRATETVEKAADQLTKLVKPRKEH